ncbi:hypothetical protein ACFFRR_008644 [Megaselia abdita]
MLALKVLCFAIFTFATSTCNSTPYSSCVIPIEPTDNNWPLIFDRDGVLFQTSDNKFSLAPDEQYIVSCSPFKINQIPNAKFLASNGSGITIVGRCPKSVVNDGLSIPSNFCVENVFGEVELKNDPCEEGGGKFLMFGFLNPVTQKPFLVGSVCIDAQVGYAKNTRALINISHMKETPLSSRVKLPIEISHISKNFDFQLFDLDRYQNLVKDVRKFLKSKEIPRFKITSLMDEHLLGNDQFLGVRNFNWNHILIPDDVKVFGVLLEDVKKFTKGVPFFVEFNMTGVYTIEEADGAKMPLLVEGEKGKKYPIPETVGLTLQDIKSGKIFEFTVFTNSVYGGVDKCAEVRWLTNVNSNGELKKHLKCNVV